jgi:hypothetical protein
MPTFAAALKLEVRRLAKKETRRTLARLKRVQKQLRELRLASRLQRASLVSLKRRLRRLRDRLPLRGPGGTRPAKSGPRISPLAIRTLRARLRLTRVRFAELVGVSPGSIFGWETGRSTPRGGSRARLVELGKKARARRKKTRRGGRAVRRRGRRPRR